MNQKGERPARPWTQWSSREFLQYLRSFDRRQQRRCLLYALGGILLALFVVFPAWCQRPQIMGQVLALRSQIVQGEIQIRNHPKLLEERRLYEGFIQDVQSRLFKPDEREGVLGILAGMTKKSGLSLTSTETGESQTSKEPLSGRYPTATYTITLEGGYHTLADLVSGIENYPKPLVISRLSMTSRADSQGVLLGQLTVSAVLSGEERPEIS